MNTNTTPYEGRKMVIYGTPITPAALLEELREESFCVSYATKRDSQVERVLELVADDGMVLVDNGAFSAFQAGEAVDWEHWDRFRAWADDLAARCPQAVLVVPDVIGGTKEENAELAADFLATTETESDRLMVVWHLDEPLYMLANWVAAGYQYIAIGSSGKFWKPGTAAWHRRVRAAFRALDVVCADGNGYRRPHIHMMRAQGQHHHYPFDSSDSTNVAKNHCRTKHTGPGHVRRLADRVAARIAATATGEARIETPAALAAEAAISADWRRAWPELATLDIDLDALETDGIEVEELEVEEIEILAPAEVEEEVLEGELCPYCGDLAELELFEVWSWREFQISTCCVDAHEEAVDRMQDPDEARALLRELGIEDLLGDDLRSVPGIDGQLVLDWKPRVGPIKRDDARAFVGEFHAHNRPPAGWRYGAGCWNGPDLVAVVMVGRPVARRIDHTRVVEVNRLCVRRDLPPEYVRHVCSKLYSWAAREAKKRGFERIITYTLESEAGTSLVAAGWSVDGTTAGGTWNRPSRSRADTAPTCKKTRWARELRRAA